MVDGMGVTASPVTGIHRELAHQRLGGVRQRWARRPGSRMSPRVVDKAENVVESSRCGFLSKHQSSTSTVSELSFDFSEELAQQVVHRAVT